MEAQAPRKVSLGLGVGIFFLPYFFAWLLLRKGYSSTAKIVAFGWMAFLLIFVVTRPSTPSAANAPAPVAAVADRVAAAAPASAPEVDPAAERVKNKALMAEIEQRVDSNGLKLKKFYANQAAMDAAATDLVTLNAIAISRGMSKAKEDQQQAKQAVALTTRVAEQSRVMFASMMEENFMKNGVNSNVAATGKGKERLVITYALMSQALVYKFQNEMNLPAKSKFLGFKQIRYTNGFESSLGDTWTVDL